MLCSKTLTWLPSKMNTRPHREKNGSGPSANSETSRENRNVLHRQVSVKLGFSRYYSRRNWIDNLLALLCFQISFRNLGYNPHYLEFFLSTFGCLNIYHP
jgi:hypothetical protein